MPQALGALFDSIDVEGTSLLPIEDMYCLSEAGSPRNTRGIWSGDKIRSVAAEMERDPTFRERCVPRETFVTILEKVCVVPSQPRLES